MHNWHETGYWKLDGQLVANPGGLGPDEKEFIYPGHRSNFLILPYLLKELPGAAGGNGLLYDFTVLALTYGALLWLLGTNLRGLLVAGIVCLSPGFMNNVAGVDTLGVPGLLGIAAMSFAAGCLSREGASPGLKYAALAVMAVYMLLNWSALFSLGVAAVYLACKRRDWLKLAAFLAVPLAIGMAVLFVSMHSRHASVATSGNFWNIYLWGPAGYDGTGMNFGKAFARVTAVSLMAWSVLGVVALALVWLGGPGGNWRRAPWPLLAGIAAVFALRNYNAHHPWNCVCIVGLGLIFSIELLAGDRQQWGAFTKRAFVTGAALFTVSYLSAWLMFDEFNQRGMTTVHALVFNYTPRHALLVVADDLTPAGVNDYKPVAEEFDRKVIPLNEWTRQSADFAAGGREVYLLTHAVTPADPARLVAQSHVRATWADRVMVPAFDFYRTKISRRPAASRKAYFDDYQLYRLN